ncbi:hypothetical protein FZC79_03275 [Rossellomorea vietnamensis]|uniref:Uncharacterized protein n=2 Tax=Rossellomorea TaxID=2837508 RepID=A0A5D4KM35_9BACI|nr:MULTISPECIES: hypothetical protein [Rossellomorea]TYR77846.1 hypothetical protein FZC79_03275 [Rossellomorea vietnamensis]TYS83324.1 hypothetical protein FZC80_03060 [Rossellomorea aquimaris]
MNNETVTDWLVKNDINNEEINFIETVLTFASSLKTLGSKQDTINRSLQSSFPGKKVMMISNLTFHQFTQILKDNDIDIDSVQLLNHYHSQGICIELCEELLAQKNI